MTRKHLIGLLCVGLIALSAVLTTVTAQNDALRLLTLTLLAQKASRVKSSSALRAGDTF